MMFKWFAKMVAEKTVGMILTLAAILILVLVWRYHEHLPSLADVGWFLLACLIWLACATALPWATFFLVGWVNKAENNAPAVLLLVFWAGLDAALAWLLMGPTGMTPLEWVAVGLAFALGGLYNLIAANQIADRMGR